MIRMSSMVEYCGHFGNPVPFGLPALAKLAQYSLVFCAMDSSSGVSCAPYLALTVSKTNGISVACGAPGHCERIEAATYAKRNSHTGTPCDERVCATNLAGSIM